MQLRINGQSIDVAAHSDETLLWVLREKLKLTGTKYGCGKALCGACTVHLDGRPVRSCQVKLGSLGAAHVTTIEGLSPDGQHPLQRAWIAEQAAQCAYCAPGQIMQAAALLARHPKPSRDQIIEAMNGNLCRCGSYGRIVKAIERATRET